MQFQSSNPDADFSCAQHGDVVSINLNLTPEDGYVPNPLFDTTGRITFVLGWGNFLPGLHNIIQGMKEGESQNGISIDAGWGRRSNDLIVEIQKSKMKSLKNFSLIKVGAQLHLEGGISVLVTEITKDTITVDANPPLAGASYRCDLTLEKVHGLPLYNNIPERGVTSRFQFATFALGCFWGAQLAFSRVVGVVGTKVGYTQGMQPNPTYEQVCEGKTRHRESVLVAFDSEIVSFSHLMQVAVLRLSQTSDSFRLNELFLSSEVEEQSLQYKHGFYYHNDDQRQQAETFIEENDTFQIELLPAATFYDAEEYHQHYLLKRGQSTRKGSKETIRCFG